MIPLVQRSMPSVTLWVAALWLFGAFPDALAQRGADADHAGLATELGKLRSKVANLEAELIQQHQTRYESTPSLNRDALPKSAAIESSSSEQKDKGMKGMQGKRGMKNMKSPSDSRGSSSGGMGTMPDGMGMMSGKMGMGMMGRNPAMKSAMGGMKSMSGMSMQSALPGFPGASHLYHIGETGLFLDHPRHISLTDDQQLQLNEIKEAALLATATAERKIDEAEQQLWTLTAEAEPDIKRIEAKAKEIAQLSVENRIAFIRSVGRAAKALTDDQRQTLVGMENRSKTGTNH